MNIEYTSRFNKSFKARILNDIYLLQRFKVRLNLFEESEATDPILRDHDLTGKKEGLRAFSVTDDIRIIYYINKEGIFVFLDIGTHKEVY